MFVNRQRELELLEGMFVKSGASLLVLYGRRRVGKTELLRHFCERHRSVFFVADQRPATMLLRELSAQLWSAAGESEKSAPVFPGWAEALAYAGGLANQRRLVLVLDEFPYLATSDRSLPSVLQKTWDAELSKTRLFLVLSGSAVSYMEGEVLSEKSPLFGRRTGQLLLEPLGLPEVTGFWKGLRPDDAIRAYAIVGGVPAYAMRFDGRRSIEKNVRTELLDKNAYLFEEVPYLLMQELREPRLYLAILQAIAGGKTTQNEIAQAVGMKGNQAAPYLRTLGDLRLLERTVPVQERHPHKSRKGSYRIGDPFFRFWFRFVFPNRSQLEQGLAETVWTQRVRPFLDEHVSLVFEDLARDHLWRSARAGALPFVPARIGSWRAPQDEIEVVAVSEGNKEALVAECKWSRKRVGLGVLRTLEARAEKVRRTLGARHVHLAVFSRSGFEPALRPAAKTEGVLLVDPAAMVSERSR
jgi:AAA+ ATPase superfamily predicted ATPase